MKYKLICVGVIVVLLVSGGIAAQNVQGSYERTYQHLAAKEKKACSHGEDVFCTHLPIVSIDTNGQQLSVTSTNEKTHTSNSINATLSMFDSADSNNHLTDSPIEQSSALINYRGNSSILFDKKSYKVNFVNQDLAEQKIALMGMPKHDEWALNGPFLDKTLIRNYLCMNIAGKIMEYAPAVRFCELFVDDAYQGVYLAMETVAHARERIDISQYNPGDPFSSYILRADRAIGLPNELNNFSKYAFRMESETALEVVYPSAKMLTPEIKDYIEKDFSKFEKALYSYDYNEREYGY